MKAFVYHTYGTPDVLRCEELDCPIPQAEQVLIRVRAASINPLDVHLMEGKPYLARLFFGVSGPRTTRPGRDVAGVVQDVGSAVTRFKQGDEVFGLCIGKGWMDKVDGSFAEVVRIRESGLAFKPKNVSFEQAASAPIAALTALQGLRDMGGLQPGHRVLIHGAGGGVGSFAVQIAKALGAHVTAVSGPQNRTMLRSLGADRVMDYTATDFTRTGDRYDIVLDCYMNHSSLACRRVLTNRGVYVPVGGPPAKNVMAAAWNLLVALFIAGVASRIARRKLKIFIAKANEDDLNLIGEMMSAGKIVPVVDRCFPFEETPDAMRYLAAGKTCGKVVLSMS